MISLVLYGRNDSYGYNLHKRAAISLNCMAQVLSHDHDEIIFVDYNTPDDFPTFPEAIQDTLTAEAKKRLRILRVRPRHHERFRDITNLAALEPIARNVGIRRSNASNRWILSTNTDMVFVPRGKLSLSEVAVRLKDGYYHLPRFEVPETLWESVDRMNPNAIIEAFAGWGTTFHLNEIIYASHRDVRYDGPGDFQLVLREDLWRISGFHESMLLGWHVDSNIARRLALLPRKIGDILDDFYGYHCDHTRQVTPAHKNRATQNDQKIYFEDVKSAELPEQAASWGLADETIEEVSLLSTQPYICALNAAIQTPLIEPTAMAYAAESFNRLDYSSEHVVPFLMDSLSSYPRDTVVAWSGAKKTMLSCFARAWRVMGFEQPILVDDSELWLGPELPENCVWKTWDEACDLAAVFVLDWGKPESAGASWIFDRDPAIRQVTRAFRKSVRNERFAVTEEGARPRRFIGINAIANSIEGVFNNHIGAALTPLATHIRQGFLNHQDFISEQEVLQLLYAGKAGQKLATGILPLPGVTGFVFYGPYMDLDAGAYRLGVEFEDVHFESAAWTALDLEVISENQLLGYRQITRKDLRNGRVALDFFMPSEVSDAPDWPRVEFRLKTPRSLRFKITRVTLVGIDDPSNIASLRELDIAPALFVGPAGKRDSRGVRARAGIADLLTYGPYFWLPRGMYEATFHFQIDERSKGETIRAAVAYHLGRTVLGRATLEPRSAGTARCTIAFEIGEEAPHADAGLLEFLTWSRGNLRFSLTSVRIRPVTESAPFSAELRPDAGVLSLLVNRNAGRRFADVIFVLDGEIGPVFQGPKLPLPAGPQQLRLSLHALSNVRAAEDPGLMLAALADYKVLAGQKITAKALREGLATLDFDVPGSWGSEVEILMLTEGRVHAEISAAEIAEIDETSNAAPQSGLLRFFQTAAAGMWGPISADAPYPAIHARRGKPAIIAQSVPIALDPASYELELDFVVPAGERGGSMRVDVVRQPRSSAIASAELALYSQPPNGRVTPWTKLTQKLHFMVPRPRESEGDGLFAVRLWRSSATECYLAGVRLRQVPDAVHVPDEIVARSP